MADQHLAHRSRPNWVRGTLVELDADRGRLTLRVLAAGRPGPAGEVVVDVSGARIEATDGDGDGRPGVRDLFPGDRLDVLLRSPSPGKRPRALLVVQRGGGAPTGGLRRVWEAA